MRRVTLPLLVATVGLVLLADYLVVNPVFGGVTAAVVQAIVLAVAGVTLAGAGTLAARRGADLVRRRSDPVGPALVLVGMGVVLAVGLWPTSSGADDPAMRWLVGALVLPLGASLFAVLFVSTLGAARRALAGRGREATLMVAVAALMLVLLLPIGGEPGAWLGGAAGWAIAVPIGGVFRGLLIGVAVVTAVVAARTALGIGPGDD